MHLLVLFLIMQIPRYIVIDSKRIGTEFLENQGAKVISRIDSITYLVEGHLEKMDHSPYEIALYQEPVKILQGAYKKGKYFIPPLDNEISYYFSLVNVDSIFQTIQTLQDFGTRFAYTSNCRSAENYLRDRLTPYSDNSAMWPLSWNGTSMYNVVAEKSGAKQDFIIISSHLDSYSNDPWNFAPGADDNASGCAVVVECARILSQVQNPFVSFKFIPFTAEEIGLIGSSFYANYIADQGLPLLGIVNSDMVGFNPQDGYDFDINLDTLSILGQVTNFVVQNYVLGNNRWSYTPFSGSDHYPFAQRGYPWVFLIESNYQLNPNYHRSTDLVSTIDPAQMGSASKLVLGVALYFALLPLPPESLIVLNYGDGTNVYLTWPRVGYQGESYVIYRGLNPIDLVPVAEVNDTFFILDGHVSNNSYYYMVRTKVSGREGFGTPVKDLYVQSIPVAPQIARIEPNRDNIKVSWHSNSELDLVGYNVYRSLDGSNFVKINTSLVSDTFYVDGSALSPVWYYYYVTAVDGEGNESVPSEVSRARPVTLSEGVLVLDEFRNGSGTSPVNPNQVMQEAFIDTVLRGAGFGNYEILDVSNYSSVTLSDIGIYGLVWVMSDDNTERLATRYKDAISEYISKGGKVIIEGYQNLLNLGLVSSYPSAVNPGNRYGISVDSVYLNTSIDFVRGYSDEYGLEVRVEPSRILPSWGGRLQNVEAYRVSSGDVILHFDSYSNSEVFEGRACGVIFGDSVVLLGFPLYYMRTQDVIGLMSFLKARSIEVREVLAKNNKLYSIVGREVVMTNAESGKYEIYNVNGRLVKKGEFNNWKIAIDYLPKGVYYLRIESGGKVGEVKFIKVR
ncbi:MAG: M28 family peptidase [candidate division WOR-3 bacterium]